MSAITDKWLKAVPLYTDTLAGAISNATVTTFQVTNGSTDLENGEVYEVTIDRVTAQGVSTGRREVVIAQYTSATKTFDCSSADYRGIEGAAQAHPVGAVVEILVTAHYLNEHRAAFLVGHTQAGAHASALPLTSPVLTTPKVVTSINDANGNEVIKTPATTSAVNEFTDTNAATGNAPERSATGGDTNIDHKVKGKGTGQFKAYDPYITDYVPVTDGLRNDAMARQAIINGNFDVWQRGTSIALTTADGYTADRWYAETATATTDKTISQQDGTGVEGSRYCLRYLAAQDVDALNTLSQALETQDSIKFRGKKLTLSFYARGGAEFVSDNSTLVSKIVTGKGTDQKVLAFTTSADGVSQNNTLTTSWVKFTCTTSAVIASDITQIGVSFAFTHAGSGTTTNYFEITQVQLCAGDVALPFQPKSYNQELMDCCRYYYRKSANATYTSARLGKGMAYSSSQGLILFEFPTQMRTIPVNSNGGNLGLNQPNTAISATSTVTLVDATVNNCDIAFSGASGLTAGHATMLSANADANAYVAFDAEL